MKKNVFKKKKRKSQFFNYLLDKICLTVVLHFYLVSCYVVDNVLDQICFIFLAVGATKLFLYICRHWARTLAGLAIVF